MGLSGYNEFKLALARASHTTDMGDPSGSQQPIASGDSLEAIFHKLHMLHTISLGETLERLDTDSVERAAALLSASEKVYCMGNGGSMVTAMEAWARFCTVTSKFIHITESHMQVITTALATPSDCILFFSYSGSTRDMEDLLTLAKERKIPIILVTHFPRSAAARLADITLLCGYNESPLQSGSIAAKIGQMFIIECLYYAFCKQNPEQTAADRECTAQAITRKLL